MIEGGSHRDSVWSLRLHFSQIVTFFNMRTKNDFFLPAKSSILEDLPKVDKKIKEKREWAGEKIRNEHFYGLGNILVGREVTDKTLPIAQIR